MAEKLGELIKTTRLPTQSALFLGGAIEAQRVQQRLDAQIREEAKAQRYTIDMSQFAGEPPINQEQISRQRPKPSPRVFDDSTTREERKHLLDNHRVALQEFVANRSATIEPAAAAAVQYNPTINSSTDNLVDESDGSVTEFDALLSSDDEVNDDFNQLQQEINSRYDRDPSFGNRMIQHLRAARDRMDFRVRYETVERFIKLGVVGHQLFQEYKLFSKPSPARQTGASDAVEFIDKTNQTVLPKQCRRTYYRSPDGMMHSRVICESFGSVRNYTDK